MREIQDPHGRGAADTRADAHSKNSGDAPTPLPLVVRDTAGRIAHALEYRQRVDAAYSAHAEAAPGKHGARGEQSALAQDSDRAERPTRDTGLPDSARDLPDAREILPNCHLAEIDQRKFSEYSLNPGHPHNGGKAEGWRALGYDVDSPQARHDAALDLREMIRDGLLVRGKVAEARDTSFGPAYKVLSAFTGPNGRNATLVTCWLVEGQPEHSHPKLTTTWAQPHRDKETPQ